MADTTKLNIGAGPRKIPGYLSVDLYAPNADVIAPADNLPYDDNTVAEIYCSHMIEHLLPAEQESALKEWRRVLAPGGTLTIRCPNFDLYLQDYLSVPPAERLDKPHLLRNIFGFRNTDGQCHHDGFTPERLQHDLSKAGFEVVECYYTGPRPDHKRNPKRPADIVCVARKE